MAGGAAGVTSIDSSAPALERARANVALNGFDAGRAEFLDADVNASLRRFVEAGRTFDAIVLDPLKLAPTVAHAEKAARAYKDINRLGLRMLAPGGVLFTIGSGGISATVPQDSRRRRRDAAGDGSSVDNLARGGLRGRGFPEGEDLKGSWVIRKSVARDDRENEDLAHNRRPS